MGFVPRREEEGHCDPEYIRVFHREVRVNPWGHRTKGSGTERYFRQVPSASWRGSALDRGEDWSRRRVPSDTSEGSEGQKSTFTRL